MNNFESLRPLVSRLAFQVPFSSLTTFRVGGPAAALADCAAPEEVQAVFRLAGSEGWPVFVLGKGSNLLVSDRGFDGVVIRLTGGLAGAKFEGTAAEVGAGYGLVKLSREAAKRGLSGLEFACAIPGSVGGAAVMNAGAHGGEFSSVVREIRGLDSEGGLVTWKRGDVEWGYRRGVQNSRCIFTTIFDFSLQSIDIIQKTMDNNLSVRKRSQPQGFSAGSVFRNPQGRKAYELIDGAGLRGACEGGAVVSGMHANFILNRGGAAASDVYRLIRLVQARVREKFGVELETEIRFLGEFDEASP